MEGFWVLRWYQDQSSGHCHLEAFEGFLFFGVPVPGLVGISEVEEQSGYGREISDEAMVEVNKAYENLYVSPVLRGRPVIDSGNFNRVHLNLVLWDDQSEVLNLLPIELILL